MEDTIIIQNDIIDLSNVDNNWIRGSGQLYDGPESIRLGSQENCSITSKAKTTPGNIYKLSFEIATWDVDEGILDVQYDGKKKTYSWDNALDEYKIKTNGSGITTTVDVWDDVTVISLTFMSTSVSPIKFSTPLLEQRILVHKVELRQIYGNGLKRIELAAADSGITTVFSNSNERIEAQLNRITKNTETPIMLISWDIESTVNFDNNGFLQNPSANIVALLLSKPTDLTTVTAISVAEAMGDLFQIFLRKLYGYLIPYQKSNDQVISGASFQLVPQHGAGKHSGVLARWTQRNYIKMICDE